MKKDKKYWKQQAKNWRDYGLEMQELFFAEVDRVHNLENQRNALIAQRDKQAFKLKAIRHELIVLRQYNIGKKVTTTTGTQAANLNWKVSNIEKAATSTSTKNWAKWAVKQYNIPTGADPILIELNNLAIKDQFPRKQYMKLVSDYNGDWKKAREEWVASGKGLRGDLFADISSGRLARAKELIYKNIDLIKSRPSAIEDAWILVQHMADDVKFQSWFLKYLQPESEEYKLLTDRIAINKGEPQVYNTQTIIEESLKSKRRWWKRKK